MTWGNKRREINVQNRMFNWCLKKKIFILWLVGCCCENSWFSWFWIVLKIKRSTDKVRYRWIEWMINIPFYSILYLIQQVVLFSLYMFPLFVKTIKRKVTDKQEEQKRKSQLQHNNVFAIKIHFFFFSFERNWLGT